MGLSLAQETPAQETPAKRLRVIGYTSGAWPCGIADYHRKLARSLQSAAVDCETVPLPSDTVYRDNPAALWRRRGLYRDLAARSGGYEASLLDLVTQWNGGRAGENMLPTFINRLRGPVFMIVHEWPRPLEAESEGRSMPSRVLSSVAAAAVRVADRGGLTHEDWLHRRLFTRATHILVHAEALRDRMLAVGIPPDSVSLRTFPTPDLASGGAPHPTIEMVARRFAHRRKIVIFGFPHPRKALDLAVRALPHLPEDVMLLSVGATSGEFRQTYVRSIEELAGQLGVRDRIEFTGEIPEDALRSAFALAEFALAPFAYATGSASFSYLMAAGVPIVATDLPEHKTLAAEGAGIELFESGDVAALARAVNALLGNVGRQRALSVQNRAFAERHTFTRLAESIRERLDDMTRAS